MRTSRWSLGVRNNPPRLGPLAPRRRAVFLAISLLSPVFPAIGSSDEATALKVERVQHSLGPASVKHLDGFIGRRVRLNEENRLAAFDINRFVRMVEEKKQREWWWIGEQPGKWLEAAVLASRHSGNAVLRGKAREILRRMIAAQEPSGYLGITDPAVRTTEQPLRGMDPYEVYFTFHALVTAHQEWSDPAALAAARKFADFFVERFGPGKCEFWPSDLRPPENQGKHLDGQSKLAGHSVHYSWEGTLLIDPMMRLYRATGDPKYLEWVKWVISRIDAWSGHDAFSKLDQVAEGKLGIHQLQPYVHAHTFHMNFQGFLQLYEATGDVSLLRKVRGAWKDIVARQMYVTGGVSVGEHYEAGHNLPNTGHVVETCASMSWMELCQHLLELTGDPVYADAIERLLWNHLFAAQTCDGDGFRYHTPLSGTKPAGNWTGPDCCSSSGARILAKVPGLIYATGKDAVYINQFVPSIAETQLGDGVKVVLKQTGEFPAAEKVAIEVALEKPATFALHIRLPGWCDKPGITVNGQAAAIEPKSTGGTPAPQYAAIQREWRAGDRLELTMPMQPRWLKGEHTNTGLWCLTRGPVVYMLDSRWYEEDLRRSILWRRGDGDAVKLGGVEIESDELRAVPVPPDVLGPVYEVPIVMPDGKRGKTLMVPFANLGQWYRNAKERESRQMPHPYAVWIVAADSPLLKAAEAEAARRRQFRERIVDEVVPHHADSERSHILRGERHSSGEFGGGSYRHAGSGWFSWDLKVLPEGKMTLLATYWGGDIPPRTFDILVDGRKIATQSLDRNKPGEFFDVEHLLPEELTRGKRKVTVRFQAHPENTAGGVFGCAILKSTQQ